MECVDLDRCTFSTTPKRALLVSGKPKLPIFGDHKV
jgi:hypothetical protein